MFVLVFVLPMGLTRSFLTGKKKKKSAAAEMAATGEMRAGGALVQMKNSLISRKMYISETVREKTVPLGTAAYLLSKEY